MKYFVPELAPDEELPDQTALEDKFGGLPWGLAPARWPLCASCGGLQSLLAQLSHHPLRSDLGKEGRVLFLFACNDNHRKCPTWDPNAGANACFLLEKEELAEGLTMPPVSASLTRRRLERWLDEQLHPGWRVRRWQEKEDGIPHSYPGFFGLHRGLPDGYDEQEYERYWSAVSQEARLGGVPFWIQFPQPPVGGRFLGQIDSNCCQAFGDNGLGYLFLTEPTTATRGWFLWQCA